MNWDQARKLLHLDGRADVRSGAVDVARPVRRELVPAPRAVSLCIASGKGGTGKSVVTACLGSIFAHRGRTLLVDADMGVGNAHILQNVAPSRSFVDLVEGRCTVREIRARCGPSLDLLAAGSGVSSMASLTQGELSLVASGIGDLEREYAHVLVDSAAGISYQTVALAAASDRVLIVTTPDVTALTDAYAFLKVLLQRAPDAEPLFVVNRAASADEGREVAERLSSVAQRFLHKTPRCIGVLPDDRAVVRSVNARQPVVVHESDSAFAGAVRRMAEALVVELARARPHGLGRTLLHATGRAASG